MANLKWYVIFLMLLACAYAETEIYNKVNFDFNTNGIVLINGNPIYLLVNSSTVNIDTRDIRWSWEKRIEQRNYTNATKPTGTTSNPLPKSYLENNTVWYGTMSFPLNIIQKWEFHKDYGVKFSYTIKTSKTLENLSASIVYPSPRSHSDFEESYTGFTFDYHDLLDMNLSVTRDGQTLVIIGNTILAADKSFIIDPTISDYKNPAACGLQYNNWINCANGYTSNNVYSTVKTYGNRTDYSNFTLDSLMNPGEEANISGIQFSLEGNAVLTCMPRLQTYTDVVVSLSLNNGTSYSLTNYTLEWACSTDATYTVGGLTSLWGFSNLTRTNITDSKVRVKLTHSDPGDSQSNNFALDHIKGRLNYTLKYGNPPVINLTYPLNNSNFTNVNSTMLNWTVSDVENNTITLYTYVWKNESYKNYSVAYFNNTAYSYSPLPYSYNLTIAPIEPDSSLMILYHFDNNPYYNDTATTVYEYSNHSSFEVYTGTPVYNWTDSKLGSSIDLYSPTSTNVIIVYKNSTDARAIDSTTCMNGCTFALWAKHDASTGSKSQFSRWYTLAGENQTFFQMLSDNDTSAFQLSQNGNLSTCYAGANHQDIRSTWHHFAGVYDDVNNQVKLYLDGTLINTAECDFDEINTTRWDQTTPLVIGAQSSLGGFGWISKIDEFAIWNRTLSDGEIMNLTIVSPTTIYWGVNASDGNSSSYNSSQFQLNLSVATSCVFDCSINPTVTANTDCANTNATFTGSGTINFQANLTNIDQLISKDCLIIRSPNTIWY